MYKSATLSGRPTPDSKRALPVLVVQFAQKASLVLVRLGIAIMWQVAEP